MSTLGRRVDADEARERFDPLVPRFDRVGEPSPAASIVSRRGRGADPCLSGCWESRGSILSVDAGPGTGPSGFLWLETRKKPDSTRDYLRGNGRMGAARPFCSQIYGFLVAVGRRYRKLRKYAFARIPSARPCMKPQSS